MIIVMGMLMFVLVVVFIVYTINSDKPHIRVDENENPIKNYNSLNNDDNI